MAVVITYNNKDLFGLLQPIPFVSKDVNYVQIGETWCQEETITLGGQFIGCSESELKELRTGLLNNLLVNYQNLVISGLGTFSYVKIQNVSFEDSDYVNILPYSIVFLHYPEGSFTDLYSNSYGVMDVSDEISYTEGEDRVLGVVRTISAKGIKTSNDAITNAQSFINERVNESIPKPFLIESQESDFTPYLVSSQETIDRITNTVSITQTFRGDLDRPGGNLVNRYSINISEQIGEFPRVTYNGKANVGREGDIDDCYNEYETLKTSILNASYIFDENVTQDTYINEINYSFSFFSGDGASNMQKIEDDFSITVNENHNSSLLSASINGTLRFGYGCFGSDSDLLDDEFDKIKDNLHFDLCKEIYEEFYTIDRKCAQEQPKNILLAPTPINKSHSRSYGANGASNLDVSYSASFNDRFIPEEFEGVLIFGDSINITPPIPKQQISEHYVGGKYSCNDLGLLTRQGIDINLNFNGGDLSSATREECNDLADLIYDELGSNGRNNPVNQRKRTEQESITESQEGKSVSYQKSYSANKIEDEFII